MDVMCQFVTVIDRVLNDEATLVKDARRKFEGVLKSSEQQKPNGCRHYLTSDILEIFEWSPLNGK